MSIVYLIVGILITFFGGAIGLKLASRMGSTMERDQLTDTVDFLEKELKKSKGRISQKTFSDDQALTLPEDTEVNEGSFDGIIRGLISKYSGMAPKKFQFLLQDPAIVNFLISEAKKNPDQAKEVLKHFIGGNGLANKESSDTKSQNLEPFIEGGA